MNTKAFAFAALVAIPGAAFAQDAADADGDGMITMEELTAAYPDVATEDLFTTLDVDGSGALDATELAAAQESGLLPSDM